MDSDLFTYQPASPLQASRQGALAGTQILVQPDLSVKDWLTDAGSRALAGFHAVMDATTVARAKTAGACLTGSTHMAELGLGINGSTMAGALSAGYGRVGLVTDLLGEARMSACLAGWYGFKPSYGLVSRFGLVGLVPSMECTGFIAPNPAEIAAALEAVAGPDENDFSMPAASPQPIGPVAASENGANRIGMPRQIREYLPASAIEAVDAALGRMAQAEFDAGFDIQETDLPGFDLFSAAHQVIASVEASSSCGKYDGVRYGCRAEDGRDWNEMYINSRSQAFGTRIKSFLFQGAYFQFENYTDFENACILRRKLVSRLDDLFEATPLLALPVRLPHAEPERAETIEETYTAFGLTLPANLAGLPALCIPAVARDGETDLGLQLIGPRLSDAQVLTAGQRIYTRIQGDGNK